MATRPVWLAVDVPAAEEAAVIAAHRAALRLAHRLLLILVPQEAARAADLAAQIVPGRQGVWDTKEVLLSFRFDRQNRLVFGSVGALRNTGTAVHRAWAKRALRKIYPQIGDLRFEHEWFGQIGMTQDNLPRFHRLEDGIVSFCGYNGRGIAPGTVFGQQLAALLAGEIAEGDLALPVSATAPVAWRNLRSAFYETGAQLVHLTEARF